MGSQGYLESEPEPEDPLLPPPLPPPSKLLSEPGCLEGLSGLAGSTGPVGLVGEPGVLGGGDAGIMGRVGGGVDPARREFSKPQEDR